MDSPPLSRVSKAGKERNYTGCDLILYELISIKQDKTREDNLKLVSIALKCLRDSVTEREKGGG